MAGLIPPGFVSHATAYGIDASSTAAASTRNRFEFIQLQSGAAVINNQIEMPSITWNVCLMKRAGGLKNGNYNVIPKRGPSLAFFSGLISILSSFFSPYD